MENAIATTERALASFSDFMPVFDIEQALQRKKLMSEYIAKVLIEGPDYGVLPGVDRQEKVLKKPGAEKLCSFFGLTPTVADETVIEDWSGEAHGGEPLFYYRFKVQLWRGHLLLAEGIGSANSREKKHRYRMAQRICPCCNLAKLMVSKWGKAQFEGGWYCYKKTGGCGAEFVKNDARIINQEVGQILNPDVYDLINTCQKMAHKRALVAAVLIGTNASDSFTQDLEEDEPPVGQSPMPDTGPHKPGTQAAADYVGEQQIKRGAANGAGPRATTAETVSSEPPPQPGGRTNPPAPAPTVPEEIIKVIENVANPGGARVALEMMKRLLAEKLGPEKGTVAYHEILAKHGIKASGNPIVKTRAAILECYKRAQETVELAGDAPKDEDVPEEVTYA